MKLRLGFNEIAVRVFIVCVCVYHFNITTWCGHFASKCKSPALFMILSLSLYMPLLLHPRLPRRIITLADHSSKSKMKELRSNRNHSGARKGRKRKETVIFLLSFSHDFSSAKVRGWSGDAGCVLVKLLKHNNVTITLTKRGSVYTGSWGRFLFYKNSTLITWPKQSCS